MNESILSRIFPYRQTDKKTPLENFLTESLAYCIQKDEKFKNDFLKIIGINYKVNGKTRINTQCTDDNYGRPDIEIKFNNTFILIESKVESKEGYKQLLRYASILSKDAYYKNKHLIYLTKNFELKKESYKDIKPQYVRWRDIYEVIKDDNNEFTRELKLFLEEKGMKSINAFTNEDYIVIKNKKTTESKMDEFLEPFKQKFKTNFGNCHYYDFDYLDNGGYEIYSSVKSNSKAFAVGLGFYWDKNVSIPNLSLYIELPIADFENSEILRILDKELKPKKNWSKEAYDDYIYWESNKPLTAFQKKNNNSLTAMKAFIDEQFSIMLTIKSNYTRYFRRINN